MQNPHSRPVRPPRASRHPRSLSLLAVFAGLAAAHPAAATWSIILVDTRTGEIAVGSATCLANFDLRNGTPVLIPGVGSATAQSFVDSTGQNRVFIRDRLAEGIPPQQIITQLASFDSGHQTRQYGIVDAQGRAATFSGTGASAWAGGLIGEFNYTYAGQEGTIAYAIQGNILTGAPVVEQALVAVTTTDGDLAARLMAGMQAARAMGGDGRCSCPGSPTGCGSPPASFSKSAHIAYMLIARAGDREGSNGIYRTITGPVHVAAGDITGNGQPDLVAANLSANSITLQTNITPGFGGSGSGGAGGEPHFPMFTSLPTWHSTGAGPRRVILADVTGNTRPDAIVVATTLNALSILRTSMTGSFLPPVNITVGSNPRDVAVANIRGLKYLDLASANFGSNNISIFFNDGAGDFTPAPGSPVTVDAGPIAIAAGNFFPSSAALDLAVACRTANSIVILRNDGAGSFTPTASLSTANGPIALALANLTSSSRSDIILACDTSQSLQVFLHDSAAPGGFHPPVTYPIGFAPVDIAAGDLNGNGFTDIVITGGSRFATFFSDGAGAFTLDRTYTVAGSLSGVALADLDGDGDLDLAVANSAVGGIMVIRNDGPGPRHGTFNDGIGCGTGDYFMNFNIAFQSTAAPDPVIQLQTLYDQWRTSLQDIPDAVQSLITVDPPTLPPDGFSTATMTITLRDWSAEPAPLPVADLHIQHAYDSAGLSIIGPINDLGGGVYTAQITAGTTPGLDRFRITAFSSPRPVTLMPDPKLPLVAPLCYPNCDSSTTPPILNIEDFTCFINRFAGALSLPHEEQITHYANCDGSTTAPVLNVEDFTCFINAFAAGCP